MSSRSSLTAIKGTRLYEAVLERLLEHFRSGAVSPGDKLPSERDIASQLGVSRTVLREAFRILESSGVVRSRPGGGRYLAAQAPEIIAGPYFLARAQIDSLLDVWQARFILEVGAMGFVVHNATDEEVRILKEFARQVHSLPPKDFREQDYDLDFHVHLARATHNRVIAETIGHYMAVLKRLRQKLFMDPAIWRLSCEQHIAIADAVEARDEDLARSQVVVHLQGIRRALGDGRSPFLETGIAESGPGAETETHGRGDRNA